jgi:hypothetical protein
MSTAAAIAARPITATRMTSRLVMGLRSLRTVSPENSGRQVDGDRDGGEQDGPACDDRPAQVGVGRQALPALAPLELEYDGRAHQGAGADGPAG